LYSIDHTADGFGPARAAPPPPADASSESALMTGRPRADERSDNELVAAVCAGDQPAFDLLFERHKRLVTRLAGRFFHRREEVEEIVQESLFGAQYFSGRAREVVRRLAFAHHCYRLLPGTATERAAQRKRDERPE